MGLFNRNNNGSTGLLDRNLADAAAAAELVGLGKPEPGSAAAQPAPASPAAASRPASSIAMPPRPSIVAPAPPSERQVQLGQ
ncbi:MAG TPA: hypothetical protein PKB10_13670, partial [Tepidisphaeraceae bacterium]|nr:hypothetical protein [Tepidisphaeraceae bacterium]